MTDAPDISTPQVAAALAIGTTALLMVGVQPVLLGELVEAKQVSLQGVGIVAMAEIVTLGLGVVLGDLLLPRSRLRLVTIIAALMASSIDLLMLRVTGDGPITALRAAAGLADGVLIWGAIGVIARTANPTRVAGIFFVVQTVTQAALGALLADAVIPHWGWMGGFTTLGVLGLLPCLIVFWQPTQLRPLAPPSVSGFRWTPTTLAPMAVAFLQLATLGAFWAYLEPLGKAAGFDARAAQTLVAGVLAMQVVGGSVASLVAQRLSVVPTLVVCSMVLVGVTATLFALPSGHTYLFALGCAVFGFVWLFALPFHVDLAFYVDASGRLAGLVPAAQLLGSAFGPLTASFIVKGDNASEVPLLSTAFAVVAALLLVVMHRRADTVAGMTLPSPDGDLPSPRSAARR